MISVSLDEFSKYGFDLASTNRIVDQVGISKGLLYKYFSTKELLFIYICELAAARVEQALSLNPEQLPDDFFEALKFIFVNELNFYRENPKVFALFERISAQPDHEVYKKVLHNFQFRSNEINEFLLTSLCNSDLRSNLHIEHVINVVTWIAEGITSEFRTFIHKGPNEQHKGTWKIDVLEELECYFELVRNGIYSRLNASGEAQI